MNHWRVSESYFIIYISTDTKKCWTSKFQCTKYKGVVCV